MRDVSRAQRSLVYARAKNEGSERAYGTQLDVYRGGVTASLPGLAGLGFDAVSIDTHAYTPEGGPQIVAELTKNLGPPMLRSTSGRWQLWDLRDYAKKAGLSPQQLRQAATALVGDLVDHVEPHD